MKTILVASGKGGCGKTTTTSMLAQKLSERFKVAALDLDVSGPNLPRMLGIDDMTPSFDGDHFFTKSCGNVDVMSPAFLLPPDVACAWSGNKRMDLIRELILKTKWDDPDILICDCPPGTGDEIIAVLKYMPHVDGVVLVTTGKHESVDDAKRFLSLIGNKIYNIPVLCTIDNMSHMIVCGNEIPLFSDSLDLKSILGVGTVEKILYKDDLCPDDYNKVAAIVINKLRLGVDE